MINENTNNDVFNFDDIDYEIEGETSGLVDQDIVDLQEVVDAELPEDTKPPKSEISNPKKSNLPAQAKNPFDFGLDEDLINLPGVIPAEMGTKVSRYPIERIKFTSAKRELISLLTRNVLILKVHYHEDTGSFICFGGKCCEVLSELPRIKYAFPAVVYETDVKGKPVENGRVTVKVFAMGESDYNDIMDKDELNGDITKYDILISCEDEQYQKIKMNLAGPARWRKNKEIVKEVVDFWNKNKKHMVTAVGKILSEKDFMEAMGYDALVPNDNFDPEDAFDDFDI